MKKSLVIISFAFIFLLSMSIVSAGFFDWITGDAIRKEQTGVKLPTSSGSGCNPACKAGEDCVNKQCVPGNPSGPTGISSARGDGFSRSSETSRFGSAGDCPRGWNTLLAKDGGNCCVKGKSSGSSSLGSLFRRR